MDDRKPGKRRSKMNNMAADAVEGHGSLDSSIQDAIGARLRAMHDELANQELPARFTELLKKLDEQDDKGKQ
jgi:hypothetical protein